VKEVGSLYPETGRKTPAKGVKTTLGGPNIVLLTINARKRIPWIAQASVQTSLEQIWRAADAWLIGYYILMPDHLHLFCAPRDFNFTIEKWVAYWKSLFRRANLVEPWEWQRSAFHYRLRTAEEYHEKWLYVEENPIRKGLVKRSEDWPYQGTINELRW
jgi:putative transposase